MSPRLAWKVELKERREEGGKEKRGEEGRDRGRED